ncbi:MAG: rsbW [Firmicutes bacterium]|nr:rsbW [Bacillota bacterium]
MKRHLIHFNFRDHDEYLLIRDHVRLFLQSILQDRCRLMEVAINEAVNNAINFGNRNKKCCLRLGMINNSKLVVRIAHFGPGFAGNELITTLNGQEKHLSDALWAESGRGLLIMSAAADYIRYNRQGTEVIMVKKV